MPIKNLYGGWAIPVEAKTASYTVVPSDCGKLFTNRGAAGAVTFTLPLSSPDLRGWWCKIYAVTAQNVIVASNAVDTLTVFNDNAADTWALQTAGAIIGSGCEIICDGTGMLLFPMNGGSDAATPLVARNTLVT